MAITSASASASASPLVIVLDLDGTIIGDITPQIISFDLAKALKAAGAKHIHDTSDFKSKLKSGLVRPFFDSFIKSLNASHIPYEFYIYTASEKTWAEHVVKHIESAYNIKFNRPIFARQYCIYDVKDREYKKSIALIRPTLLRALKKKYSVTFSKQDIANNLIVIDNNNVYHPSDHRSLLVCSTYNFRVPENVVSYIKPDTYRVYYQSIHSVLKKYIPNLTLTSDYYTFQKEFYTYYVSYIETQLRNNNKYIQDKLWLYLKDIIVSNGIRSFDESSIKYITNTLRARLGMAPLPAPQVVTRSRHQIQTQIQPRFSRERSGSALVATQNNDRSRSLRRSLVRQSFF